MQLIVENFYVGFQFIFRESPKLDLVLVPPEQMFLKLDLFVVLFGTPKVAEVLLCGSSEEVVGELAKFGLAAVVTFVLLELFIVDKILAASLTLTKASFDGCKHLVWLVLLPRFLIQALQPVIKENVFVLVPREIFGGRASLP